LAAVLYPGTFDPITNGHEEIVNRAAGIFDKVVVGIAQNTAKQPLFSLAERLHFAGIVFSSCANVEVMPYDGLTVEFARMQNLKGIIRGLRSTADFEYERQLAGMNKQLDSSIETVYLTPSERNTFVSSTLIRDIAANRGDVSMFVHPLVMQALAERYRL
jgi:pantetheine-phosphate adenylyltransferase